MIRLKITIPVGATSRQDFTVKLELNPSPRRNRRSSLATSQSRDDNQTYREPVYSLWRKSGSITNNF